MASAASSISPSNTETVTLRLPSGEEIDGIVPAGLSDDDVRSYVRMKRPDLFGAPPVPKPQVNMQQDPWGIQDNPNQAGAGLPGMTGNRPVTGGDLVPGAIAGGAAAIAAAPTLAAPVIGAAAKAATPAVEAIGNWAEANPLMAKALLEGAKLTGYGSMIYKGLKRATK